MSTKARMFTTSSAAEEALRQSEKRFRALLEHSYDAVVLTRADGKTTYASPAIKRVIGYTPEEFINLTGAELMHPDDLEDGITFFRQILQQSGITFPPHQTRFQHKKGSWRWIEYTATNLIHDPAVGGIVFNFRDITERKQAEERQRLLNEANTALFSSLDHQISLQEIARLIVPSFADYCRIAVLDEQQQIKEITVNHIDPHKIALVQELYERYRDQANTTHGLQKLLQTGRPELISTVSENVLEAVKSNSELLQILEVLGLKSYMGTPLLIGDRIIGAITFSSIQPHRHYTQDDLVFAQELARRIALVLENARLHREAQEEIAERKQTEAQLRQSEERYRLVVENTTDLITLLDMQGTIVYISPSCEKLLGYRPEEMIGKSALSFNHPDDLPVVEEEFAHVMQGGVASIPSYRARHKEGHWVIFTGTGSAIYDDHGQPALIVSTSHDITSQKELEQRKDEFISMASHELKTPVTSLKGFTNVLQRRLSKRGDEQALHYLARMDAQINKLTKLISDLLDISKMQTGKLEYREEPFDLAILVQETLENVQATTQTHRLLLQDVAQVQVFGDRERIGQVLINLLTNAIKYSPQAEKVLVCVWRDEENACVSVQDFGIGIAESHQERIFERFYQVTEPMEKTYPGLGIGLYISSEIVKRHHGRMWVESKKGEGATFYVRLPLYL